MKGKRDPKTNKFVRNLKDKDCLVCGISFHPRFENRKVCSRKCMGKMYQKNHERNCAVCSKVFSAKSMKTKFCSYNCYGKSLEGKFGEQSNGWQGGLTSLNRLVRALLVYKVWRNKVLKRDNYSCVECKSKEHLDVDHIKSLALIIRENGIKSVEEAMKHNLFWDIKNGRTLCRECHQKTPTYLKSLTKKTYAI